LLVLRRFFDVVDHNHVDWRLRGFQLQTELLLDRCKEVGHFCLAWRWRRERRSIRPPESRELKLIGRPIQCEIISARESASTFS
jgi:hypothetical protein